MLTMMSSNSCISPLQRVRTGSASNIQINLTGEPESPVPLVALSQAPPRPREKASCETLTLVHEL